MGDRLRQRLGGRADDDALLRLGPSCEQHGLFGSITAG
jgi:hypothetical protein